MSLALNVHRSDRNGEKIIHLLNAKKKSEQSKICRELIVSEIDIANLCLAGQSGYLFLYKYSCKFIDRNPTHLSLTDKDLESIQENGKGRLTVSAKKTVGKIFHYAEERPHLSLHLFYTSCHYFWHLLYFDERDAYRMPNQWNHGTHVHYVSDLYCKRPLAEIWQNALRGSLRFSSKEHIRFQPEVAK
jgi:hypothetical protein